MYICRIQYNWKQAAGFTISDPVRMYYNLFHFPMPVEIRVGDELLITKPDACIFSKPMAPRWFYFHEDGTMNWMHNFVQIEPLLEKYDIPLNTVFYPENPAFISDSFRKMHREFYSGDPYREELLDGYVEELLIKLSRSLRSSEPRMNISAEEQKLLRDLRWAVQSEPERQWTVAEMARQVSLSPSRFHAVYKAMFDSSPMADVIAAKIDRAKSMLLLDDRAGILAISEKLGYKNQYHFIRQFKSITGMTPGAYRKNRP